LLAGTMRSPAGRLRRKRFLALDIARSTPKRRWRPVAESVEGAGTAVTARASEDLPFIDVAEDEEEEEVLDLLPPDWAAESDSIGWIQAYVKDSQQEHHQQPIFKSKDGLYVMYYWALPGVDRGWWVGPAEGGAGGQDVIAFLPFGQQQWCAFIDGVSKQLAVKVNSAPERPSMPAAPPLPKPVVLGSEGGYADSSRSAAFSDLGLRSALPSDVTKRRRLSGKGSAERLWRNLSAESLAGDASSPSSSSSSRGVEPGLSPDTASKDGPSSSPSGDTNVSSESEATAQASCEAEAPAPRPQQRARRRGSRSSLSSRQGDPDRSGGQVAGSESAPGSIACPITPSKPRSMPSAASAEEVPEAPETPELKPALTRHQQQEQAEQEQPRPQEQEQREWRDVDEQKQLPEQLQLSEARAADTSLSGAADKPVVLTSMGPSPLLDAEGAARQEKLLRQLGCLVAVVVEVAAAPESSHAELQELRTAQDSSSRPLHDELPLESSSISAVTTSHAGPLAGHQDQQLPGKRATSQRQRRLQRDSERAEFAMLVKQVTGRSNVLAAARPAPWSEPVGSRLGMRESPAWLAAFS